MNFDRRANNRSWRTSDSAWHELLAHYAVAEPDLARERELDCRADTKFALPLAAAASLLRGLRDHYVVLPAGGRLVAAYRTLYFDTAALDLYHAHRQARRVRHKVRIRHYPDRQLTTLEVKTRRNARHTTKVRRTRAFGDEQLTTADQAFVAECTGLDQPVLPQVTTDFRRVTLLSTRSNERVTIDVGLAFAAGETSRWESAVAIIEVKQWPFSRRTAAMSVLRRSGAPIGMSKYCAAIALTHPAVPHRRFVAELRTLNALPAAA